MGHQLTQHLQLNGTIGPWGEAKKFFCKSRMDATRQGNCNKTKRFENRLRFSSGAAAKNQVNKATAYATPTYFAFSAKSREQECAYGEDGNTDGGLRPFGCLHETTFSSSREPESFSLHIDWDSIRAQKTSLQQHKYDDDNDSSSIDSVDSIQVAKLRQLRSRQKKESGRETRNQEDL